MGEKNKTRKDKRACLYKMIVCFMIKSFLSYDFFHSLCRLFISRLSVRRFTLRRAAEHRLDAGRPMQDRVFPTFLSFLLMLLTFAFLKCTHET